MLYLETYVERLKTKGHKSMAESILETAEKIGKEQLEGFSFITHEIGLLFGNVQSGKTAQMFGIMCKAADLGFPVFILLTTDNVVLQQQTLERVKNDLTEFCICGENDARVFVENELVKPTIIVLKKNYRILKLWASIINSTDFMLGNPLFIVDDEADAASLNTMINNNRQSSINKYLEEINSATSSSLYLQVTGTPQAILLQAKESGWHPYFVHYFKPGKEYLGGDFFFANDKPQCIEIIDEIENPLRNAVLHHLIVSAQMLLAGRRVCNFMIHPSVRVREHTKCKNEVVKILNDIAAEINADDYKSIVGKMYEKIEPNRDEKCSFDAIYDFIKNTLLDNRIKIIILNGKNDIDSEEYAYGSNIIIGGNTLGRGVTFAGLQTIYYTRSSKKPQADTMWQHSRMFGYDRDKGMMSVYIDERLYNLFKDINATNNSIIAQIEKGFENIRIYYPDKLSPTRSNVLENSKVFTLSGGTNYYPLSVDNNTIDAIDCILSNFDEKQQYYQVNLRFVKKILSYITTDSNFKMYSFLDLIDMFLSEKPACQAILIVRRNRDVRKGSGALLSPTDWNIGAGITDMVVLTMYQMSGNKGWEGKKIWVPNIKLPDDVTYYDVIDEEREG